MTTENGSAVAMVMLVLAVVSLIGVALLSQSRMDMQLTSSLEVYDDITSRADAVATLELTRLRKDWKTFVESSTCCGESTPQVTDPKTTQRFERSLSETLGAIDKSRVIVGYNIDPPAGFQKGASRDPTVYKEVYYRVTGRAWRKGKSLTQLDIADTTVTAFVSVVSRKE